MNVALIFAGGTGKRMKSGNTPKQFLELNGKPIIVHTIEHFDKHPQIDAIVVVCIEGWIDHLKTKLSEFGITKVSSIVPGGTTGQGSIRNGLYEIRDKVAKDPSDTVVLIHDGVRPLINDKLISDNIESVRKNGNAITVVPAIETIIETDDEGNIAKVADRSVCKLARAPQSFILSDILEAHRKSLEEGAQEMIDSAMLMQHYGTVLHTVEGPVENIKITTPMDYYVFKAMVELQEDMKKEGDL
ncbi:MAG: 2-C-methyl-D-erythritol 4-phosphate cytidylyltransferase [Clostridiales bacterium]|nr:2-C-methyl-D-erythritol 4-phosphate cytidylyltransferase [Clostridiales bacterium]